MTQRKTDCEVIHVDIVEKVKEKMPDVSELYNLSDFFKIIGDKTRIQLLWALKENEMCVCDLAVLLDMTKSAISHQLKTLRVAKLIKSRRDGKNVFYSLNDNHVDKILKQSYIHIKEK